MKTYKTNNAELLKNSSALLLYGSNAAYATFISMKPKAY